MDCDHIKKLITDFFSESIKVESDGEECQVIFPIFGSDNDLINLYIRPRKNEKDYQFYITDFCETILKLYTLGVEIRDNSEAKDILDSIEQTMNIKIKDNEIIGYANENDLGLTISQFISSLIGIEYIRYISRPRPIPTFRKDVKEYLKDNRPDYYENIPIEGISGTFKFDFEYIDQEIYIDTLYATIPREALHVTDAAIVKKFDLKEINEKSKVMEIYDDDF